MEKEGQRKEKILENLAPGLANLEGLAEADEAAAGEAGEEALEAADH